jgi:hypothetical protein
MVKRKMNTPEDMLPILAEHDAYIEIAPESEMKVNVEVNELIEGENLLTQIETNEVPESMWRRQGGAIVRPHTYKDVVYEDPSEKAWSLSEQDREMIHYGVVAMENDPTEVGVCFNVSPEVVLKVVEIVSQIVSNRDE